MVNVNHRRYESCDGKHVRISCTIIYAHLMILFILPKNHLLPKNDKMFINSRPSYWQVEIQDITLDNKQMKLCGSSEADRCQVAVDTGTSLMAGPTAIVNKLVV
jgi:hypothetical protein